MEGETPDMGGAYCTGEPAAGTPPPANKIDNSERVASEGASSV